MRRDTRSSRGKSTRTSSTSRTRSSP
jgi:hypothetical protein